MKKGKEDECGGWKFDEMGFCMRMGKRDSKRKL
jgi:hypothetical protein